VLEREEERPLPYEEIAAAIRRHLENQRSEATVAVLMEKLRDVANLQLFPEHIE